jgi:hypothetical protein
MEIKKFKKNLAILGIQENQVNRRKSRNSRNLKDTNKLHLTPLKCHGNQAIQEIQGTQEIQEN